MKGSQSFPQWLLLPTLENWHRSASKKCQQVEITNPSPSDFMYKFGAGSDVYMNIQIGLKEESRTFQKYQGADGNT